MAAALVALRSMRRSVRRSKSTAFYRALASAAPEQSWGGQVYSGEERAVLGQRPGWVDLPGSSFCSFAVVHQGPPVKRPTAIWRGFQSGFREGGDQVGRTDGFEHGIVKDQILFLLSPAKPPTRSKEDEAKGISHIKNYFCMNDQSVHDSHHDSSYTDTLLMGPQRDGSRIIRFKISIEYLILLT